MTSLYGLLGVPPDASTEEIRRAYYRAARRLHPDVNPDTDAAAAMRRLNEAWAVLGDPIARRRYDAQLSPQPAAHEGADEGAHEPDPEPASSAPPQPPRFLRPSALIVAILLVIFVVTAYAGHVTKGSNSPQPTSPTSAAPTKTAPVPATNLIGDCLEAEPGYDAVVPCTQPNLGLVMMLAARASQCPADTRPYQLIGQAQWVCLRPSTSRS